MHIAVHLTPNAKHESLEKVVDLLGNTVYNVRVTAKPVNGEANKALIKLLAKHFGVGKSFIKLLKGEKSRNKIIAISG